MSIMRMLARRGHRRHRRWLGDGGADDDADDRVYPAADSVHFDNQTFADIIARGPLAVQHDELHLQNVWMIDDSDGDNNELLNDSESDGEAGCHRDRLRCSTVGGAAPRCVPGWCSTTLLPHGADS
ncbi:hypothetical protein CYMTET_9365 [Cymbomonas tetramitiformis]|uniref:Uncharacterized protein n=1 Tax=Cymbomonas tetramitiformis TaxID=36881 RepID=A0AAE0LFJ1_9CHLO|nr:hypothetical protein CYMTET_39441 [Cymbomonas tetramitiformis]KAK3282920.1 hypothetical protein CYMTET_9365 [Cymbomonas tetramitiformis]